MKNDCVNGEGSKVLMANFKILWIHVLYLVYGLELHSKKQDVTETCNQEEMKIKKGCVI